VGVFVSRGNRGLGNEGSWGVIGGVEIARGMVGTCMGSWEVSVAVAAAGRLKVDSVDIPDDGKGGGTLTGEAQLKLKVLVGRGATAWEEAGVA
jgi:hypothetical protein